MASVDIAEKLHDLASEWVERGNVKYRMYKMSGLQWTTFIIGADKYNAEFEISGSLVACGRNGGNIAVMNRKGNLIAGGTHLLHEHVVIFNACGMLQCKIPVSILLITSGKRKHDHFVLNIQLMIF